MSPCLRVVRLRALRGLPHRGGSASESHSLRSGLYKYRTSGALWGETLSETETTTDVVGCTNIAPPVLSGARRSQRQRPQLTQWVIQKSLLRCSVGRLSQRQRPQLTQWVVQISHLRCSLGRGSLRNRDHNLRSGLYRNRSFGVLWGDALRDRDHNLRSGLYRNRSFGVLWGDSLRDRDHNLRSGLYRYRTSGALWGEALSETETTTYAVGCTEIAPSVLCGDFEGRSCAGAESGVLSRWMISDGGSWLCLGSRRCLRGRRGCRLIWRISGRRGRRSRA